MSFPRKWESNKHRDVETNNWIPAFAGMTMNQNKKSRVRIAPGIFYSLLRLISYVSRYFT